MSTRVAEVQAPNRAVDSRQWKAIRSALLLLLILLAVRATFVAGQRLGMETILSTRHVYYSLPYAVSQEYFGARGYVILRDVAELFIRAYPRVTNATIAQAIALKPSPDRLMYFPGDDKGAADFAILAFHLFGFRVESLYSAWFALYLGGILAFAAVYWHRPARLAALFICTCAMYVACFALPLTTELLSVHNPRAFGAVSLVPLLHLGLAMIDRHKVTTLRLVAASVQGGIIAFAVHVRSTEWWQVLGLIAIAVYLAMRRGAAARRLVWPCATLAVALAGLDVYQRLSVDREYDKSQLRHRVFWHNVGIGFALNPVLAQKYDLIIDDMPMIQLVRRRLVETGRADELQLVFMPAGQEDYRFNGIARDYARYEREARSVVRSIVWNDKWEAVRTFLIYKPRLLVRQLMWAMGYQGYSIDDLYLAGQSLALACEHDRAEKMIYLDFLRPWMLAAVVAAVWLGEGFRRRRQFFQLFAASLAMCGFSLLPAMAAYPIISALAPTLVTISLCVLAGFAWAAAVVGASAVRIGRSHLEALRAA
jgi:hypothetical protein